MNWLPIIMMPAYSGESLRSMDAHHINISQCRAWKEMVVSCITDLLAQAVQINVSAVLTATHSHQ